MARFWLAVLAALLYSASANAQFNETGPLIGQRSQAIGVPSVPYTGPVVVPSSETTIQGFGSCDSGCSATIPATVAGHAYVMRIINFNPTTSSGFSLNPSTTGLGGTCTFRSQGGTVTTNTVVVYLLVCENINGGVTTASLFALGGTGEILNILGYEISNVPTSGVFDVAGSNTNGVGGGTNVSCNLASNTSHASELILSAGYGYNTASATTSTSGWAVIPPGSSIDYSNNGVASGSNYTVAFVASGATQVACAEVALNHP